MRKVSNILPPTLLLGVSALLSSLLGVWRDNLLAKTFGATSGIGIYNLDVYYAAFKIPDLLYFILVTGAISAAFIPIFTQYKKEGKLKEAWEFASNMLHAMLILVSGLALVAFIFAPYLAKLVASGFEPEAFDLTVRLMRIMLLSPLIFTVSSIFISLQDSFKTFFYRSLVPIFYNLGIIFSIFYFAQDMGVIGLTWGVILGAVLSLLIQLPSLRLIDYKHVWKLDIKAPDLHKAFKLMLPRVLTMGMYQFSQVIYTLLASFLAVGSVTILYFSNNIYSLPLSVIGVAFSITTFATFSELAMEKAPQLFALEIKRVMHQILFLIFPATIGMMLLRSEIISTILLGGKFSTQDAELTAQVLFFMLISLFTHSLILLLTRGFYAYHDTKTPFYASFLGAMIGVLTGVLSLKLGYGLIGIGVGISLGNILTFIILFISMRKKLGQSILDFLPIVKMLTASFMMGVAVYFLKINFAFPEYVLNKLVYLISMGLVGAVIYFGLAYVFGIQERKLLKK